MSNLDSQATLAYIPGVPTRQSQRTRAQAASALAARELASEATITPANYPSAIPVNHALAATRTSSKKHNPPTPNKASTKVKVSKTSGKGNAGIIPGEAPRTGCQTQSGSRSRMLQGVESKVSKNVLMKVAPRSKAVPVGKHSQQPEVVASIGTTRKFLAPVINSYSDDSMTAEVPATNTATHDGTDTESEEDNHIDKEDSEPESEDSELMISDPQKLGWMLKNDQPIWGSSTEDDEHPGDITIRPSNQKRSLATRIYDETLLIIPGDVTGSDLSDMESVSEVDTAMCETAPHVHDRSFSTSSSSTLVKPHPGAPINMNTHAPGKKPSMAVYQPKKARTQRQAKLSYETPTFNTAASEPTDRAIISSQTIFRIDEQKTKAAKVKVEYHGQSNTSPTNDIIVASDDPDVGWPISTKLYHSPGTTLSLKVQSNAIQKLLRLAIHNTTGHLLFRNAFPEAGRDSNQTKNIISSCAKSLCDPLHDVYLRLQTDAKYGAELCAIPDARINTLRSSFRKTCTLQVSVAYGLKSSSVPVPVLTLAQNYNYIYPRGGTPAAKTNEPYQHPAFIEILHQFFFATAKSPGRKFQQLFDSHAGRLELPIAVVALVGAGIYAVFTQYKPKLTDSTEASVYTSHVEVLESIQDSNPAAFHTLMADLYARASGNAKQETASNLAAKALQTLDIHGMHTD